MDTNNMQEKLQKYDEFRNNYWTVEHVKNMTLDEYTNTTHDSFTYDIENWTRELGSIKGRSSFIFGIYKRNDKKEKENNRQFVYTKDYAWEKKFGDNIKDVYKNVHNAVIEVIEAAQIGDYATIERSRLHSMFKWKLAFLYQNLQDVTVTPIYTFDVLKWDVQRLGKYENNMKISDFHIAIKESERFSDIGDVINHAAWLWEDYHKLNIGNERRVVNNSFETDWKRKNATSNLDYIEYEMNAHIILRRNFHNKLEKSFKKYLRKNIKAENIIQDDDCIDFKFDLGNKKYICELKPSSNQNEIKYAIQSAVGQILRYSYNKNFNYKIIVFQNEPKDANLEFLNYLENEHKIHYLYETSNGNFYGNIFT